MAKDKTQPAAVPGAAAEAPAYQIVGLQKADAMPIEFDGRTYDLAKLTPEQAAYLLQFPEQIPYLKPLSADVSAPAPTE